MPEIKLPEVKLRGFRDMSADDIKQAIADARPDVKLSDLDPRGIELPKIDLSRIDLSRIDLAGAASAAAATAAEKNPLRRRRRSRAPMVLGGLVIAALGALAIMNLGWLRVRVAELVDRARSRMDAARVNDSLEPMELDTDDYTGSVGIPIQTDTFADTLPAADTASTDTGFATNGSLDASGDNGSTSAETSEGEIRSY
jgi:hypothetical protein